MTESVASFRIDELKEGQKVSFLRMITEKDVTDFAGLTGDKNPLHMDDAFAQAQGFSGRVVHGALLAGFVSRMVGMHLPGERALLHSLNLKFVSPTYIGDTVRVTATVDHLSPAAGAIGLSVLVENSEGSTVLARAELQVGMRQ
jgi:acyl dehydratase